MIRILRFLVFDLKKALTLMDFPIHIDTISTDLSILYFNGSHVKISKFLNIFFILANSADPDEIPHVAVFHLGLLCLPMYLFTGPGRKSQSTKSVF